MVDRAAVEKKLRCCGVSEDVRGDWLYETRELSAPAEGAPDVGSLEAPLGVSRYENRRVGIRAQGEIRVDPVESTVSQESCPLLAAFPDHPDLMRLVVELVAVKRKDFRDPEAASKNRFHHRAEAEPQEVCSIRPVPVLDFDCRQEALDLFRCEIGDLLPRALRESDLFRREDGEAAHLRAVAQEVLERGENPILAARPKVAVNQIRFERE